MKKKKTRRPRTKKVDPLLVGIDDVAKMLRISRRMVFNIMAERGRRRLPHVRIGRCVRFRPEAIWAWCLAQEKRR